jgi:hypothetical protein
MRFRKRSAQPTIEPAEDLDLGAVPLADLYGELRARSFEVFPEGVWARTVGELERRAEQAEMVAGAAVQALRDLGAVADRLEEAESKLSEAVGLGVSTLGQASRAEYEAEQLAALLVADDIAEFETGNDD